MNNNELLEIQQTLQQIYLLNIEYFKQNHPNLYKKIIQFEQQHIENYALDFIDGNFQLIDLQTKQHFYSKNPFTDAQQRVAQFDYSHAFSLIKLESYPKKVHYRNEINAYEFVNEYISKIKSIPKQIHKFIFIGTLLGVHINDFHNQIKASSYMIIEPNLEIFRLSMFMTDYSALAKDAKLFFSVAEENTVFEHIVQTFLHYNAHYNNLIYFELGLKQYENYLNQLSSIFTQESEMRYPFSEYIISLQRGYECYFNQHKIINLSKKHTFLNDKKVLFLGAGVSLAKNIEWLYLHQDEFVIVASSAVLKHLEILDIIPDIIILLDGQKECMISQFNVSKTMYTNSIILASIKIDPSLLSMLQESSIFYLQNSLELFPNFGYLSGVTVGDIGVDILAKLGAQEIYLLGIDASLDSVSGKTHVGTHQSSRQIDLKCCSKTHSTDFQKDIVYVKGNLQSEVPTFLEYTEMIENLSDIAAYYRNIAIYNLSNGAYFQNTTPKFPQDIEPSLPLDKQLFNSSFIQQLLSIYKQDLSINDINALKKEKKILKKLCSYEIDHSTIYKEFIQLKKSFQTSLIINILDKYFNLINPYYFFMTNKKISDTIFTKQFQKILQKFNSIYDKIDINQTGKHR